MKEKKFNSNKILKILGIISIVFIFFIVVAFIKVFFNALYTDFPEPDRTNYDKSCIIHEDCKLKDVGGMCSHFTCINKEEVEEGKSSISKREVIKSAVARTECMMPTVVACKCKENICTNIDFENPETIEDCNFISNEGEYYNREKLKDLCFYNFGIKHNNFDSCFKINEDGKKKDCIIAVATNLGDYALCNSLVSGLGREECISNVAIATNNSNLCKSTMSFSDSCFHKIALNLKKDNLCKEMEEGWENCLINFRVDNLETLILCDIFDEEKEIDCIYEGDPEEESLDYTSFLKIASVGWRRTQDPGGFFKMQNNGQVFLNPFKFELHGITIENKAELAGIGCGEELIIPPGGRCNLHYIGAGSGEYAEREGPSKWKSFSFKYNGNDIGI